MKYILLTLAFLCASAVISKDVDLSDRGVVGDGITDNWLIIQTAIDEVIASGGGTLYFPEGEFAIYNKSLVIWGSNISLIGRSSYNTSIVKRGNPGYFGDCLDIVGLIAGYSYYSLFNNKRDYNRRDDYVGSNSIAENIRVKNITITTCLDSIDKERANNVGILNARNVHFENCVISDAPQTNVGIVNDTEIAVNENIKFVNCSFINSGQHNVRVSSYNKGEYVGNKVEFVQCRFLNVKSHDVFQREIVGYKLHLWYRGIGKPEVNQLKVKDCTFDATGFIFCNGINNNISITQSNIASFIIVQTPGSSANSEVTIKDSHIAKLGGFEDMLLQKLALNKKNKVECGFVEEFYGIQFPCM